MICRIDIDERTFEYDHSRRADNWKTIKFPPATIGRYNIKDKKDNGPKIEVRVKIMGTDYECIVKKHATSGCEFYIPRDIRRNIRASTSQRVRYTVLNVK